MDRELKQVVDEINAATKKFPTWPSDPFHALSIIGEELGELNKAVLQFTYEPKKGVQLVDIREEATQVAAVAIRFLMSLGKYNYAGCDQHKQGSAQNGT